MLPALYWLDPVLHPSPLHKRVATVERPGMISTASAGASGSSVHGMSSPSSFTIYRSQQERESATFKLPGKCRFIVSATV